MRITLHVTMLAAAVALSSAAFAQQKITLRYAHVGAEGESQTRYATELDRVAILRRARASSTAAARIARLRYRAGR